MTVGNLSPFAFLSRLTIRTKTYAASAAVLICLIGMGVTVYLTASQVARNLQQLSGSNLPTRGAAVSVNNAVVAVHMSIFRYVSWASNSVSDNLLQSLRGEIEADFSVIRENFNELATRPDLSSTEKADLKGLKAKLEQYESTAKDVLDVGSTDAAMATMMLGQTDDRFTSIENDIHQIFRRYRRSQIQSCRIFPLPPGPRRIPSRSDCLCA